jgi:hypothetical protein
MKKKNPTVSAVLCALTVLLLASCFDPLGPGPEQKAAGANTGRVLISIVGEGAASATETEPSAAVARTLLPEFTALSYTATIKSGSDEVFSQTITTTSLAADLAVGYYTVLVEAKNSAHALVARGSGGVYISLGTESPVTIRMASVESESENGTFEYSVTIPSDPPVKSGVIEFSRLSGGTNPAPIDLMTSLVGTASEGSASLPAGFYRAVLKVETLGKRVAQTMIVHVGNQTTTRAEFNLDIGDFAPSPPDVNGLVIYITSQAELAAIREHIGSEAMNFGKNAYILLNDIALAGPWTPIGNLNAYLGSATPEQFATAFQGYFFGENHRITGLTLPDGPTSGGVSYTGLFGAAHKALVQDLTVETSATQITLNHNGTYHIGFVAGVASESELLNVTVKPANLTVAVEKPASGGISGYLGGVAGYVRNSRLRGIKVSGVAGSSLSLSAKSGSGWDSRIGGVTGHLDDSSEITGSAVALNINTPQSHQSTPTLMGGLAGINAGTIKQSFYSGTLALLLDNDDATQLKIGGIAGRTLPTGIIEACYAAPLIAIDVNIDTTHTITPELHTGGLVGANNGAIRNSYAAYGIDIAVTTNSPGRNYIYSGGVAGFVPSSASHIDKCYATGSLQISINGTKASDEIYTGGITGGPYKDIYGNYFYGTVSSSAALAHSIAITTSGAPLNFGPGSSRIVPIRTETGTLSNNIAFGNMLINGSALADAVTSPENDQNGLGKTAAQLKTQAAYAGLGWDFAGVWEMGPVSYPYPVLKWQNGAAPVVPQGFEPLGE